MIARRLLVSLALLALLAPAAAHGSPAPFAPGAPVQVTLELAPRHSALLARLAAASSGRPPLSPERVAQLFYPGPRQVARVSSVMAGLGLRPAGRDGLALSFQGTASQAQRAFGARIAQPPPSLSGIVTDVEGPGGSPALQPLSAPSQQPVVPQCSGPGQVQAEDGGYLPKQLASSAGYRIQPLLHAGFDGSGEALAVVEFSGYDPGDVATYQSCMGLSVPVTDVPVAGGNSSRDDALEVALDLEVAISAAPGLDHAYAYLAPPTGSMASVVNAIVADRAQTGVTVISVSWGLCERLVTPSRAVATGQALQLAAVAGITVLAASGDYGAIDCGDPPAAVSDPSSQPFATGVGGTTLRTEFSGSQREIVWDNIFGATGGGISRNWTRPTWQSGAGVIGPDSSGAPCDATAGVCREVPDLALSASPGRRGSIVYCATASCGGLGWQTVGGTSASAPLMAGIVADMNEYSLGRGGNRLGFASPFLYAAAASDPTAFRDVTFGDNGPGPLPGFTARPGYDMASGLGSPRGQQLAADLAAYSAAAPMPATTVLTAAPTGPRTIRVGQPITFSGTLSDSNGDVVGARVWVTGFDGLYERRWAAVTDATGHWTVTVHSGITRLTYWRAVFLGSEGERPAQAPGSQVHVVPPLAATADLPQRSGVYSAMRNRPFLFVCRTLVGMAGRTLVLEVRRGPTAAWHVLGTARVGIHGYATRSLSFAEAGPRSLRWRYRGSLTGPWISALSAPRTVIVR